MNKEMLSVRPSVTASAPAQTVLTHQQRRLTAIKRLLTAFKHLLMKLTWGKLKKKTTSDITCIPVFKG